MTCAPEREAPAPKKRFPPVRETLTAPEAASMTARCTIEPGWHAAFPGDADNPKFRRAVERVCRLGPRVGDQHVCEGRDVSVLADQGERKSPDRKSVV